ncbi:PPOX class F420-dependent oxidoreductase [Nocardioides antri]|uniref:PPOX class F420-dependent oxidoreductase n=1 Tax=Nocardioides antri TaxID=2607659 RepID=A0A5B1M493_9ACTN|nr:PPOX class F420-dependent oxidoreductase [Nocardioides antri]KAA1427733.1 PPOX class F420-dependent oxidoreductase [Nocardioides antri]
MTPQTEDTHPHQPPKDPRRQTRARLSRRLVTLAKRPMVATMDDSAHTVIDRPVRHTDFNALTGHHHCLLVTYKRDGSPVPAPVWFARDGERLFVWTEVNAYKAKRLRRDPRALIAPCSATGKPLGDPIAARGRILETVADRTHAARVIKSQWTPWQRAFAFAARPVTEVHYLEFVPHTHG